jgi:hypothetical protein
MKKENITEYNGEWHKKDERERIIKIIEGMKKERQNPLAKNVKDRIYDCDVVSYNEALQDLIKTLKE